MTKLAVSFQGIIPREHRATRNQGNTCVRPPQATVGPNVPMRLSQKAFPITSHTRYEGRPHHFGDGLVEVPPERQLPQRGRPHNSSDGLVEVVSERYLLQESRPKNPGDGLVKVIPEQQLLQGGRPHNFGDGLVEGTPER